MSCIGFGSCQVAISRVILVLLTSRMYDISILVLTIVWIDKQVKSIVVEFEVQTVGWRHRAVGLKGSVVLVVLVIATAIESCCCTTVSRYNQFFNVYLQHAGADKGRMAPYEQVIGGFADLFRAIWEKGAEDGTLRTEIPWQQAFSVTLHMMLAAVTRYAVGLAYQPEGGSGPEEELTLLRDMIVKQYSCVA